MKPVYIIITFFLSLIITTNCNTDRIKPVPPGTGWFQCLKCKGYGYIYAVKSPGRPHVKSNNPDEKKEYNDFLKNYYSDYKKPPEGENDGGQENSGDSGRRLKKIPCTMCNGRGWIRKQYY